VAVAEVCRSSSGLALCRPRRAAPAPPLRANNMQALQLSRTSRRTVGPTNAAAGQGGEGLLTGICGLKLP